MPISFQEQLKKFDEIVEIYIELEKKGYIDKGAVSENVNWDEIKSLVSTLQQQFLDTLTEIQGEMEERLLFLTDGSGKSNKEMGDIYADAQHLQVRELRESVALIETKKQELMK